MKNLKNITMLLISGALILSSCKKTEEPTPVTPTPVVNDNGGGTDLPSASDLSNFFANNLTNASQSFSIDASTSQTITGSKGTQFQFYANSFQTMSGQAVTGNIDITLTEIYGKADMILLNKSTLAYSPNGTGLAPLISGGEFNITATQNGQELQLAPGAGFNGTIPAPNGVDPNMGTFYGSNANDTLTWTPADSSSLWGQGTAYSGYFDSIGWINADYFMNNSGTQTNVQVELPSGFTNLNCKLFISFDGLNSITDFYNYSNGVYATGPSYTLPVGLDVHFVAISIIAGNPHVAIIPTTIAANHYETISALAQTTTAQLVTNLNNLP